MRFSLSVRLCFFLFLLFCLGAVAGALVLGEVFKLQPCYLCNLQRLYYLLMAFFALCGLALPRQRRLWTALIVLVALGGMAAAIEQSWMQYAPQNVTECGFGEPKLSEQIINWLGERWPAMFMVTGLCTVKEGSFLGLTLANWSIFGFLGIALLSAWFFWQKRIS